MIVQIRLGRVVYAWIGITSNCVRNKSLIRPYELRIRSKLELTRSFFNDSRGVSSYRPKLGSRTGPFSWPALGCVIVAAGALLWYERILLEEKASKHRENSVTELASAGKADIGGPFQLIDHHKKQCTDKDFLGNWLLIYFGYAFCPDVCPEALEKIGAVLYKLETMKLDSHLECAFITVDPERDTPDALQKYLKGKFFHAQVQSHTCTCKQLYMVSHISTIILPTS